ncbi:MAG: V-type ATP synthase subunit A [Candidatus Lokiarchaeota archaeon]|nr:V-type ATP synthase subunit A [Candidatus Lokiarchaeota archaeon]
MPKLRGRNVEDLKKNIKFNITNYFQDMKSKGYISGIKGSLIEIKGLENQIRLFDLVKITKRNILSEVIQIHKDYVVAQCFEDTLNLTLNEEVTNLHEPLSMELAPGLLSHIFDGIQRPLEDVYSTLNDCTLQKGIEFQPLSKEKKWHFVPKKREGDVVYPGDVIGIVQETPVIVHKIMLPYNMEGMITSIVKEGHYTIVEEIYRVKSNQKENVFCMLQKTPITKRRPFKKKIDPKEPLLTGIRMIDLLFPVAKGGTIAIPGGFGTGKTVIQECISKFCNADIVVFIGCGEPGNEIANILKQFSETIDSRNGRPLLEHIVLVVNTSNMPVSAREASLFSGITIGEYYRDMGYDVAVIVDSISRWAESLREISSLLEEMPAEEGYPAYLSSKLSSFYERAGVVKVLGHDYNDQEINGSLTIISSISPPGGDLNEPVTAASKRVVQGIWVLDARLAYLKQYPALDWLNSYSNYPEYISEWWRSKTIEWQALDFDWFECRKRVNELLAKENEFLLAYQLTGELDLLDYQKFNVFMARLLRNTFLNQNAFDKIDNFTDFNKLILLIKLILIIDQEGRALMNKGLFFDQSCFNKVINIIKATNMTISNDQFEKIIQMKDEVLEGCLRLMFPS